MNREIVGESGKIYPLQGDVTSQAGNQFVTVTGIQSIPVNDTLLSGGEILEYNPNSNNWEPTIHAAILVNSSALSDDYTIQVNVIDPVLINGA